MHSCNWILVDGERLRVDESGVDEWEIAMWKCSGTFMHPMILGARHLFAKLDGCLVLRVLASINRRWVGIRIRRVKKRTMNGRVRLLGGDCHYWALVEAQIYIRHWKVPFTRPLKGDLNCVLVFTINNDHVEGEHLGGNEIIRFRRRQRKETVACREGWDCPCSTNQMISSAAIVGASECWWLCLLAQPLTVTWSLPNFCKFCWTQETKRQTEWEFVELFPEICSSFKDELQENFSNNLCCCNCWDYEATTALWFCLQSSSLVSPEQLFWRFWGFENLSLCKSFRAHTTWVEFNLVQVLCCESPKFLLPSSDC